MICNSEKVFIKKHSEKCETEPSCGVITILDFKCSGPTDIEKPSGLIIALIIAFMTQHAETIISIWLPSFTYAWVK